MNIEGKITINVKLVQSSKKVKDSYKKDGPVPDLEEMTLVDGRIIIKYLDYCDDLNIPFHTHPFYYYSDSNAYCFKGIREYIDEIGYMWFELSSIEILTDDAIKQFINISWETFDEF